MIRRWSGEASRDTANNTPWLLPILLRTMLLGYSLTSCWGSANVTNNQLQTAMGKIRTTTKATDQQVIKDQDEFCRTLDDIARKGVELDTLQAAKETAMQQVLTEHDPKISELAREIARLTKMAEQWASPRRDELFAKGRKSGTTALTTYGYRLGQPSLKPAPGWTWDKVVALLKSTRRRAYLVTKVTPDKEAIRQHVKPHKLAKLGLEIKQVETFYVERSTRDD